MEVHPGAPCLRCKVCSNTLFLRQSTTSSSIRTPRAYEQQAIAKLARIEGKPPMISAADMFNVTEIAIHLIQLKNAASQHGFLARLSDQHNPDESMSIYLRWIVYSVEDRDVRALVASPMNSTHPYEQWQAIPQLYRARTRAT